MSILISASFGLQANGAIILVTTTADTGVGSLRQAILTANGTQGSSIIDFLIVGVPPFTITPATVLPAITEPVVIDGTSQLGYTSKPVIQINGALVGGSTSALRFSTGYGGLLGLAINGFSSSLVELDGPSNTIAGNFLGTDVTGAVAMGGGANSHGVLVKSAGNLIGGTNAGSGNVISGGNGNGVYIVSANNNVVQGNLIGVNAAGTLSLSNVDYGVVISGGGGNLIGGSSVAARNIISGNGLSGMLIWNGSASNTVLGNFIGTDISGEVALGNKGGDGITCYTVAGNVISNNVIAANTFSGITISGPGGNVISGNLIGTDAGGKTKLPNLQNGIYGSPADGNEIGGTNAGSGNVISGNGLNGVSLTAGSTGNLIQGNLIGLSAAGTAALANGQDGVLISGAVSNVVGGVTAGARNVISGNAVHGVAIVQSGDTGNAVSGNFLGTDISGTKAVANGQDGAFDGGGFNTIGGVVSGAGNVISGNSGYGLLLEGGATGNLVAGNLIGLDVTGKANLGNNLAGVVLNGAVGNVIGSTVSAGRNVISANGAPNTVGDVGVYLYGATTVSNVVEGNYIGTDVTGLTGHGNGNEGVFAFFAPSNQIGGSQLGAGNLISGNYSRGIWLSNASETVIQGNFIGTTADGTNALANSTIGIDIYAGTTNVLVGGAAPGAGNRIAFAPGVYAGVRVRTGSYNDLISGNAIFGNGALGIDLGTSGVTPNSDCEEGASSALANYGQNYPVVTNVVAGPSGTLVRGYLDSGTGKTYRLEFFANPASSSSGYGQGQVYLGAATLALGNGCTANFAAVLPAPVPAGWVVAATATDPANNTSEFSADVAATSPPRLSIIQGSNGNALIAFTNTSGTFTVQQTYSLTPPVVWTAVTTPLGLTNGNYYVTASTSRTNVFYRLTAP